MTRRSKIWMAVGVLFSVVNIAGGVYAAVQGEGIHSGVHWGLALLGAYLVWRLVPKSSTDSGWSRRAMDIPAPPNELTERLTHLEQAVDAVAIEVERIGEGQRFITRSFAENGIRRSPREGASEPAEIDARKAAPDERPS